MCKYLNSSLYYSSTSTAIIDRREVISAASSTTPPAVRSTCWCNQDNRTGRAYRGTRGCYIGGTATSCNDLISRWGYNFHIYGGTRGITNVPYLTNTSCACVDSVVSGDVPSKGDRGTVIRGYCLNPVRPVPRGTRPLRCLASITGWLPRTNLRWTCYRNTSWDVCRLNLP